MTKQNTLFLFLISSLVFSCGDTKEVSSINPVNWKVHMLEHPLPDSLVYGKTYLSVYSQIYTFSEVQTHDLTATISLRNMNEVDSVFILSAKYYNTEGQAIRSYFDRPVFLKPLETIEIVIDEADQEGGTGANFIFEWKVKPALNPPFFEAVMVSNKAGLGLSFTTEGKEIRSVQTD